MRNILLKDGVKYQPYAYDTEDELENIIFEHRKDIFGENSIFLPKQKITTSSGIGAIPDAFVLSIEDKKWFVIEVELESHPLYQHVVAQISKFNTAINSASSRNELIDAFYNAIVDDPLKSVAFQILGVKEIYKFISEIIKSDLEIIIFIDDINPELEGVCSSLPFSSKVIIFKTYCRENVGIGDHIHQFEPMMKIEREIPPSKKKIEKPVPPPPISKEKPTPQTAYFIPILETLVELGGSGKIAQILEKVKSKMKPVLKEVDYEKLPNGQVRWINYAEWARKKMIGEGRLRPDSPRAVWEITEKGEECLKTNK
jgi:hypothetical protein